MKKFIAFSIFAIALLSQAAYADDRLSYTVLFKKVDSSGSAFSMPTQLGIEATASKVSTEVVVREINSNLGVVENVAASLKTGAIATVFPEFIDKDGKVTTALSYTVWDKGVQVAKGSHFVKLARGESVDLPGFNSDKVTLALSK